jgi:hypothetical protein
MSWKKVVPRGPSPLRGSKSPSAKIGPTDALMIYDAINAGFSPTNVAAAFGISKQTAVDIALGARWGWLTEAASAHRSKMRAIREKVLRRARA